MPTLLFFADSPRGGCGATVRLDSGEPCLLSIAPSSVRVKKFRFGIFGPMLYKEKVAYRAGLTAQALSLLFEDSLLPPGFGRNPVLRAFTNAILHCATCAEVTVTLNEAIARADQQAAHDKKVISDFAALMAMEELKAAVFHDVAVLPHPKETILRAIEREIVRERLDARVDWLKAGAAFLPCFQEDVGSHTPSLTGIVEAESNQIGDRIAAATRLRDARAPK
jgi:hypothetical protein